MRVLPHLWLLNDAVLFLALSQFPLEDLQFIMRVDSPAPNNLTLEAPDPIGKAVRLEATLTMQ